MIQSVKLSRLRLSELNVRKSGDLEIEPLAADIAARGVLQNLLVTPVAKPRGTFDVFDGGRRLRALQLLAERGEIDADAYDVPVKALRGDRATLSETSLAANFHQLKMTPAEECRAFQFFLGKDGDLDAVAKRFGITRRFVEGRLRLAGLAAPIFDALAAGEITLDMAKAYASTESEEKQLQIWSTYGRHGYVTPDTVRRAIATDTIRASEPVALLVGVEAYVAAGGKVSRDLFSDTGDRWVDPEIAERLCAERMEAEATRLGIETGLAWIRPVASAQTYSASRDVHRVVLPEAPLTDEQEARVVAIDERLATIEIAMEDEELGDDACAAIDTEAATLDEERTAILDRPRLLPDELRGRVGTFLTLSRTGEMVLDGDYYSETPLRADEPAGDETAPTGSCDPDDGDQTDGEPQASGRFSARLADSLAMQRRDVLAAALLGYPALALDLAIFVMADAGRHHAEYGTTLRAGRPQDPLPQADQPETRAHSYIAASQEELEASWCEIAGDIDRFEAFRALDDDRKAGWLAHVVATSLEAKPQYSRGTPLNALQARLAAIMEVDVAAWWRPTADNFFDKVTKGAMVSILGEVGGAELAARQMTSRKPDIAAACEKLFAGEVIVETGVKERALAWIPDAMRLGAPSSVEAAPATPLDAGGPDDKTEADAGSDPVFDSAFDKTAALADSDA